MKAQSKLLILLFFILIFASCSKSGGEKSPSSIPDTDTFNEKVSLPEEISIDFNLDEVKTVEKANTYLADYYVFDEQQLIDTLIQYDIKEKNIWREGPQIIAASSDREETLNIYDGGEAFGVDDGDESGFSYRRSKNDFHDSAFDFVANISFRDSHAEDETIQNSNYASFSDLDFLPYQEALTDITKTLHEVGISSFKVDETYSLNLGTMQDHYDTFINNNREIIDEQDKNLNWTKEHETYIFSLQQLVNDIPLINQKWEMPDGTKTSAFGNPMPLTDIHLAYDHEKIREISTYNILDPAEELEEVALVSLYDALATLINDYSLTILEEDISVISAELSYLSIPKDDQFELIPGWVFRSTREITFEGDLLTEYKTDVVNAVNGKFYQGRWR